jgi:hypothetical protein
VAGTTCTTWSPNLNTIRIPADGEVVDTAGLASPVRVGTFTEQAAAPMSSSEAAAATAVRGSA